MGDMVIREEFSWTPEQLAEAAALMRRMNDRIPAMVAGLGALLSAAADAAAALAAFGEQLHLDEFQRSWLDRYGDTSLITSVEDAWAAEAERAWLNTWVREKPRARPASPIGERHGPCELHCRLTFPHQRDCLPAW